MMRIFWGVMALQWFLLYPVWGAVTNTNKLPAALLYKEKPIDPLCLVEFNTSIGQMDLDKCGIHAIRGREIAGENQSLISKGYIGYDYTIKINDTVRLHGYSYYKTFGENGSAVIVQTINHGGGTGEVSSLSLVAREGHDIKVTVLNTGDRCNHGLVHVAREQGALGEHLIYTSKLTAYDFLKMADNNPYHLKAFDDLDDCAICCKATAVFERAMGANFTHETLLYINLSAFPQDTINPPAPQKYQACFDTLVRQYIKQGKTKLNRKQFIQFTHEFNQRCIKRVCAR